MRLAQQVEHLEHLVGKVARLAVALGLADELGERGLLVAASARHLQHRRHHDLRILGGEETGPVGRELALPAPLEQRDQDGAGREPHDGEAESGELDQERCHRAVEHMVAHHVADLVAQHIGDLVVREQLQRARVEDDEGLLHSVRSRVHHRALRDEEGVARGGVEGVAHLRVQLPDARKLVGAHLHGVRLECETDGLLAEEAEDRPQHLVELREPAKSRESGAIGAVLPGARRNPREGCPSAPGGTVAVARSAPLAVGLLAVVALAVVVFEIVVGVGHCLSLAGLPACAGSLLVMGRQSRGNLARHSATACQRPLQVLL